MAEVSPRESVNLSDPDSCVLFVAEKPSVALAVASAISHGNHRTRGQRPLVIHDCFTWFAPARRRCSIRVTSVVGHVFGLDFEASSGSRDLASVFAQKTRKVVEDTSEKLGVVNHLKHAADGCGWLCLWLDCDREGENICYEVLKVLSPFTAAPDRVWRARFSAVTETEVKSALARLSKPNRAEAHAVDVRQQLDLKVGVAFTRLLTRTLRDAARQRFALPALRLLQVL